MPPKKAPYYGRKSKSSISMAKRIQSETEEQHEKRLKNARIYRAARRAAESVKQRKERLKKQREYMAAVRGIKRQKQRKLRILQQQADEAARKTTRKLEDEKQLQEVILNFETVMDAATEEQHEEQLRKRRISDAARRAAESIEQREERLKKQREYHLLHSLKKINPSKQKNSQCQKVETAIVSSENDTLQQLTAPPLKLQTKQQKNQFENTYSEKRQMFAAQPTPVTAPSVPVTEQSTSKHVQVLAPSGQKAETKPVQKHQPQLKIMHVIANHQQLVMSNLSSLWKNRKLCDAAISNGTSIIKVHKVLLSAVCPKLLSRFGKDILSQEFLQVNFPKEVSTEALNAFAEYMYNGILDLDCNILKHLKIIAKKLDMKEFEQLCDSHIPKNVYQSADAPKQPLIQKVRSVPAMTSLLASLDSPVYTDSTPSVPTQVVNINQESTEAEQGQVKMETDHMFDQESEVASLAPNKSENDIRFVICPNIKTEPVETDNKYGHLSSSSNQIFTSTTSPSRATAASTSISSIPTSSTKFPIPFSQSTDVKSTKLKAAHSYKTSLVSDLSPVSRIVETICFQSTAMNGFSSKPLSRQSISTSSIQLPSTSTNNAGIYPVTLFMTGGDNLPLLTPNAKSIDLYKTELT